MPTTEKEKLYYYKIIALIFKRWNFKEIARSLDMDLDELLDFMEEKEIATKAKVPLHVDEGGPRLIYKHQEYNNHTINTPNQDIRLMFTSDWHLDHVDDLPELKDAAYELAQKKNVDKIIHLGDYLNGPNTINPNNEKLSKSKLRRFEKYRTGTLEGALERLKEVHCPDIEHYFITGNHDLEFLPHDKVNIGELIQSSCKNSEFLGNCLAYLNINGFRITLSHGNYESINNSYQYLDLINLNKQYGYLTKNNPHIIAQGHFHFGQLSSDDKLQIPCLKKTPNYLSNNKYGYPGVVFLNVYPENKTFQIEYEAVYFGDEEMVVKKEYKIKR